MATKEVAIFSPSGNLPAFAKNREPSELAKSLMGGTGNFGKRISIKGGVFRLIAEGKEVSSIEDRHLDIVIVNAAPKIARTYYKDAFDENAPAAPDCWSPDGEAPDKASRNLQSTSCATCPQNVKGSGNGDSRACRYSQRLAVVLANDMDGDVLQLNLAATSIFGKEETGKYPLQAYARWLAAQDGIDPSMLVTRMSFDLKATAPKLFFKGMRWLSEEEYTACQKQSKSDDARAAITMTVSQVDRLPNKPVEKPEAKPQAEEPQAEAEEAQPEPQVKKNAAAKPTTVKTQSLAATVAQWDDE